VKDLTNLYTKYFLYADEDDENDDGKDKNEDN
jgi:hypothetical protein